MKNKNQDMYRVAHELMDLIQYDDRLNNLTDEDFEIIWSHIKEHYGLK